MYSTKLIEKVAREMGAEVVIEPEWGRNCVVKFTNGGRFLFKGGNLNINYSAATKVATDKHAADFFLQEAGYPTVPNSRLFFSNAYAEKIDSDQTMEAAYAYAKQLGWPVIVKPNGGSLGAGVALVYNKRQFYSNIRAIFKHYAKALVQQPFMGQDYRLVALDGQFMMAYHRMPLNVEGDGQSTIEQLLLSKKASFDLAGRKVSLKTDDPRILHKLNHQGFSYSFVPEQGQKIFLLDNANLSTGGDVEDVSQTIHEAYKEIAINITKNMGLRLCGVDLLIDADISQPPVEGKWCVIEINASPGMDHFMHSGSEQLERVHDLYARALRIVEASFDR